MKPIIVKIVIGLVGFGGGFAAGFFAHKKATELKFEEVSEEEFQQIEANVKAKQQETSHDKTIAETAPVTSEDIGIAQKLPDDPDELRNHLQGKTSFINADKEQKMAYEKLWKATKAYSDEDNANNLPTFNGEKLKEEVEDDHPSEEDFEEDFLEQIEQEAVEAGNNFAHPPYQVDLAGFWNDHPEFDHVTIKYYEPDNVWLDENDEVIADISSYIGTNTDLFKSPGMSEDEDIRFICNERYGTNYEVIRHHRSYKETVGE